MAELFLTLRSDDGTETDLGETPFASMDQAYLDICAAIPDTVADLMRRRRDPFGHAFVLSTEAGEEIIAVPLTELLSGRYQATPRPWRATTPDRSDRLFATIRQCRRLSADAEVLRRKARYTCRESAELVARARSLATGGTAGNDRSTTQVDRIDLPVRSFVLHGAPAREPRPTSA